MAPEQPGDALEIASPVASTRETRCATAILTRSIPAATRAASGNDGALRVQPGRRGARRRYAGAALLFGGAQDRPRDKICGFGAVRGRNG